MIAGVAFLEIPALVLAYMVNFVSLPFFYFILIVWSVLILTTWLFLITLVGHSTHLRNAFFALYFPEASLFTMIAFLPQIGSFNQQVMLVLSCVTILAYLIPFGIMLKSGTREMETKSYIDEAMTARLRDLVGKNHKVIPEVHIMPAPIYGKTHLVSQDIRAKRILITKQLAETLTNDEMNAALCNAYYIVKSRCSVKNLFVLFTPLVALTDLFVYFIMGGSPSLGVFLVPLTGVLLVLSIILFPLLSIVLFAKLNHIYTINADRFVVKITGNVASLLSSLNKIHTIQGNITTSDSKLVQKFVSGNEKFYIKRIMKLEKIQM
jgi:Zn-dependent protease with chaperone function